MPAAKERYEILRDKGLYEAAVDAGLLVSCRELDPGDWPIDPEGAVYLIEHDRVPYVSYPYEWGFSALKAAALFHLDFQLWLLDRNAILVDASAYNVQFIGARPVFIDMLSIDSYQPGSHWLGYKQFLDHFLNPLLLRARKGVSHNAWLRGSLEGISSEDIASLLCFRDKLSLNVLTHIVAHARLQRRAKATPDEAITRAKASRGLSKRAYQGLLTNLRNWISRLEPLDTGVTVWGGYASDNSYASDEAQARSNVIAAFTRKHLPKVVMDLGCNSGDFSVTALENGAEYAIGFDFDQTTVDLAFDRARKGKLPFLSLWQDSANSSPNQGWRQAEREGFDERAKADAVFALAFEHHLAIGKNLPLADVVAWIVSLAPKGIIEFVQKDDPTVQKMLALREDIFPDYSESTFTSALESVASIKNKTVVTAHGRTLFEYCRS